MSTASGSLGRFTSAIHSSSATMQSLATSITGTFGALVGSVGVMDTIKSAFSLAAEAEETETAFGTMLQSAEAGAKMVRDITRLAAETPLESGSLQQAARLLLNFNVAGEQVLPTLRTLGDVAGGNADKLMGLSLAFGQTMSAGKLMGQDLNQMIQHGFNPLQEISRTSGRSLGELRKEMEKGNISAAMIANAFRTATQEGGRFHGAMENASKTLTGLTSTMRDEFKIALRAVGKELIEGLDLKRVVKSVGALAQSLAGVFQNMDPNAKKLMLTVLATVTGFGVLLGAALSVKAVLFAIGAVAGTIGAPLLIVIGAIVAAVALWVHHVGGVGAAMDIVKAKWNEFLAFLQPVIDAFRSVLPVAWETFKGVVAAGLTVVTDLWTRMVDQVSGFWEGLKSIWSYVQTGFSNLFGLTNTNAQSTWTQIRDKVVTTIYFIEYTLKNMSKVSEVAWLSVKYGAVAAFETIKHYAVELPKAFGTYTVTGFQKIFKAIFESGSAAFTGLFGTVGDIVSNIPKLLKGELKVGDMFANAFGSLKDGFDASFGALPTIPERQIGDLEKKLLADLKAAGGALYSDFQAFLATKKPLAALGVEDGKPDKPIPPPIDDKQWQKATKEIQKFDAALWGSTESLARVISYRERLYGNNDMVGALVKNVATAPAAGSAAVMAPVPDKVTVLNAPADEAWGPEIVNVLHDIRKNTTKDKGDLGRPTIGEANLEGGGGDGWI